MSDVLEPEVVASDLSPGERLFRQIVARPFERRTWDEFLYLLSSIPAAIVALVIWTSASGIAFGLAVTILGIPLLIAMFWVFKQYARFERMRLRIVDDRPLMPVYKKPRPGFVDSVADLISDPQAWKDFGWMIVLSTVGLAASIGGIALWLGSISYVLFPLWGWAIPGDGSPLGFVVGNDISFAESWLFVPLGLILVVVTTWICAAAAIALATACRACLGTSQEGILRTRVTELERTREESLSRQTTQISRIERDLHDGAQARLVALAMDLGMAETKIDDDPDSAKQLVSEARDEAQRVLQELRDLVRGIGPQILRDRGLEAALVPVVARSPIPVNLKIELGSRPAEASEIAAYFVISEALANAIKHSKATSINVQALKHDSWLFVRVSDNGAGGAALDAGEGLRGLSARVKEVDGRLDVDSPPGGPTIIDGWLPFG
ncbi:MAG: sensor histidine kinase [Solirubrobacterales bacterium]